MYLISDSLLYVTLELG